VSEGVLVPEEKGGGPEEADSLLHPLFTTLLPISIESLSLPHVDWKQSFMVFRKFEV